VGRHATEECEGVRKHIARFINAAHETEIALYRGATEAINVVANGMSHGGLEQGDEIIFPPLPGWPLSAPESRVHPTQP
jgi:cysteine desulfurase/selenocysteine lyase